MLMALLDDTLVYQASRGKSGNTGRRRQNVEVLLIVCRLMVIMRSKSMNGT